jgi:hypothetical protein
MLTGAPNKGRGRSAQLASELRLKAKGRCVCVFITAGPMIKLCAGGEGDSEGHVL